MVRSRLAPGYALIPIDRIKPGDNNRRFFPGLEALADQIAVTKWVQVVEVDTDGNLISGERRYRACQILNDRARRARTEIPWPELPGNVIEPESSLDAFDANIRENAGRLELRFIEWARIFQAYREKHGLSNAEIAQRCGYEEASVSRYISILEKCHPDIIARLENGEQIPIQVLIQIHSIRDKNVQLTRLEQWHGNPAPETENQKAKQRQSKLPRSKMLKLIAALEDYGASEETLTVARYMAGMRATLPKAIEKKLSLPRIQRRQD